MTYKQICWDFLNDEDPPYPILPLYVKNPDLEMIEVFYDFKVDTGFNGTIGINDDLIRNLQLKASGSTKAVTPIGDRFVPYYQLHVKNHEWDLEEYLIYAVKTPRLIIGRSVMKGKRFLIDFENSNFCYLKEN